MSRRVQRWLICSFVWVGGLSVFAQHAQGPANGTEHSQLRKQHVAHVAVIEMSKQPEEKYPWGAIRWLMSSKIDPGAKQTLGVVRIDAGKSNALHLHPNCEELLYVLSGTGTTTVDNKTVSLRPGDLVRVPAGVLHQATASGSGPLIAVISYSSGDRQVVTPGKPNE